MSVNTTNEQLQKLRVPFPENQISYLPKGGVQVAYVGHAALTDRLLDVDPLWTWEPMAVGDDGLPKLDAIGGLWIKLTVCGVTRLGYGDAGEKKGCNAMKERIGDGLRNAAMRFGAALDLWHKGDLHGEEPAEPILKEVKKQGGLSGIGDDLSQDWKTYLEDTAKVVSQLVMAGKMDEANAEKYREPMDEIQELYMERFLDSKVRSALRKHNALKAA